MAFPSLRSLGKLALGTLVAGIALARPAPAAAFSPFLVVPDPAVAEATPAFRYANMTDAEAIAELDRRMVLYSKVDAAPGVRAPVRLTGRLHGVYIHSSLPPDERVTSIFEILDARLALALDDFAAVLEKHDIDEVVHFTMYRPNVAAPDHGVNDEPDAGKPAGARARATQGPKGPASGVPAAGKGGPALKAAPRFGHAPAGKAAPAGGVKMAPGAKPAPAPAAKAVPSTDGKAGLDAKAAKDAPVKGGAPMSGTKQKIPGAPTEKSETIVTAPAKRGAAPAGAAARTGPQAGKRPLAPVAHREAPAPAAASSHHTSWAPPGTRHPAGLAIDVGLLHKRDGRWLSVARQFQGHIGDRTCGDGVKLPEDPDARELHSLVCEQGDEGIFTYVLTPNYNAAHADHFHMEIKPGVHWFLYH